MGEITRILLSDISVILGMVSVNERRRYFVTPSLNALILVGLPSWLWVSYSYEPLGVDNITKRNKAKQRRFHIQWGWPYIRSWTSKGFFLPWLLSQTRATSLLVTKHSVQLHKVSLKQDIGDLYCGQVDIGLENISVPHRFVYIYLSQWATYAKPSTGKRHC